MSGRIGALPARHRAVARLVAEGMSNRDIGAELRLSAKTVANYLYLACRQLGLDNRAHLAALVVREELGREEAAKMAALQQGPGGGTMALGAGKYDDLCTLVREKAHAQGAIVVIFRGDKGEGFSVQAPLEVTLGLARILRNMADEIEGSIPGIRRDS